MGLEQHQSTEQGKEEKRPDLRVVSHGHEPRRPGAGKMVKGEFRLLAILCMLVGVLLLLEQFRILAGVHRLWPVFPAFVGAGLLVCSTRGGARTSSSWASARS